MYGCGWEYEYRGEGEGCTGQKFWDMSGGVSGEECICC